MADDRKKPEKPEDPFTLPMLSPKTAGVLFSPMTGMTTSGVFPTGTSATLAAAASAAEVPAIPKSQRRDISHLRDGAAARRPGQPQQQQQQPGPRTGAPPTMIPEQYHVKEDVVAPQPGAKDVSYDEKSKVWKATVFPSAQPTSRQEVLLLEQWLNKMLVEMQSKSLGPIEAVKEAQRLYAISFNEILRQVYVTCTERGQLLEKIWARYLQLFDHVLKIRERERAQYNQKLQQQMVMYQQLYKDKDEAFNNVYLQLAAEKEKLQMAKDKLERAVLLLHEDFKRRLRKEAKMKKVISHLKLKSRDASEGIAAEEEEYSGDEALLPPDLSDDCFSASNLLVVHRLQFIEEKLRAMKRAVPQEQWDMNFGSMAELDSLLATLSETISNLSESPAPDQLSADPRRPGDGDPRPSGHVQVEKSVQCSSSDVRIWSVPRTMFRFWSQSFRVPKETIHDKAWAIAHINAIYSHKLASDEESDAAEGKRTPLPEFVYMFFLSLYGVRQLAEARIVDFFATVEQLGETSTRAKLFMRFCDGTRTLEDLNFFLYTLAQFFEGGESELSLHDAADGAQWITIECAKLLIDSTFRDQEPDFRAAIVTACEEGSLEGKVDFDLFMEAMVERCHTLGAGPEEQLGLLFATTFGPGGATEVHPGQAQPTLGEFTTLLRSFGGSDIPDAKLHKMYRQVADQCESEQHDRSQQPGQRSFLSAVIKVARAHNLLSWKAFPPTTVDRKRTNESVFSLISLLWCSASIDFQRQVASLSASGDVDSTQAKQTITERQEEFVRQMEARESTKTVISAFRQFNEQTFFARQLERRIQAAPSMLK